MCHGMLHVGLLRQNLVGGNQLEEMMCCTCTCTDQTYSTTTWNPVCCFRTLHSTYMVHVPRALWGLVSIPDNVDKLYSFADSEKIICPQSRSLRG